MTSIIDAAVLVLQQQKRTSTMKLQKLCYYSQALALVNYGRPIFSADFQAWKNGPVAPELFEAHRGKFWIREGELDSRGSIERINQDDRKIISSVCQALGSLSGSELSERTHREDPWVNARGDVPEGGHCSNVITKEVIRSYYAANPVLD